MYNYVWNQVIYPLVIPMVEYVPDFVIRYGIRSLLKTTLIENEERYGKDDVEKYEKAMDEFVQDLKERDIAESTDLANKQHYEVPSELYLKMLGKNLKYSSCLFTKENVNDDLDQAEEDMLDLVCDRLLLNENVDKSKHILDLGCGWGSCGLYMAKKYPNYKVSMVSNSKTQREFILNRAKEFGLKNVVEVYTMDANVMDFPENSFDRIVTNEMFEHMKNYQKLLKKVSKWLKPTGFLFVHIFVHKKYAYHYVDGWMAENFFTGGTMPSKDLLLHFQDDVAIDQQWSVNGVHYSKTLEAWLKRSDDFKQEMLPLMAETYGKGNENSWHFNWRLFYLACSELFKYNNGNEWFVAHYRFRNKKLE